MKDLRIIKDRDLANTMLVDNALYSYYFSMGQGIPIMPYSTNKADTEMIKLTQFLMDKKDGIDLNEHC